MTLNIATDMLTGAAKAIGERQRKYGPPNKNFACIAALWQGYLRGKYGELATLTIDAADVAAMSALIKVARLAETPDHEDSWVDLAGYAACGRQVTAPLEEIEDELAKPGVFADGAQFIGGIDHAAAPWWGGGANPDGHPVEDYRLGDTTEMQTTGPLHAQDCAKWHFDAKCDCGAETPKAEFTYRFPAAERGVDKDGCVNKIDAVLGGGPESLWGAMLWIDTPQGHGHWSDRAARRVPLSEEDRAYLTWLRGEFIRRKNAA